MDVYILDLERLEEIEGKINYISVNDICVGVVGINYI